MSLSRLQTDGLVRVNGSMCDDVPSTPESQGRNSPPRFEASPSSTNTEAAAASAASPTHHSVDTSPTRGSPGSKDITKQHGSDGQPENNQDQKGIEQSSPPSRPTSLPGVRMKSFTFKKSVESEKGFGSRSINIASR